MAETTRPAPSIGARTPDTGLQTTPGATTMVDPALPQGVLAQHDQITGRVEGRYGPQVCAAAITVDDPHAAEDGRGARSNPW